jgi:hypothetical protein
MLRANTAAFLVRPIRLEKPALACAFVRDSFAQASSVGGKAKGNTRAL